MSNKKLLFASIAFLSASSILCDPYPWADNVCNQTIPFKKDIVIEKPVQYEIQVQSMCGLMSCTKTRLETRIDRSLRTILHHVVKATCCAGFTETPDRKCAPICLQSCNNGGECVAPESCKCKPEPIGSLPGFAGPTCSRFVCVQVDKWGSKCDRSCNCTDNSYCSADTGKCNCYPGWYGPNCMLACNSLSDSISECQGANKLPHIIEPEANLMTSQNLILERHRSEPLVLNDEIKIKSDEARDWRLYTSNYLIAILSVVCFIFIIAFIVFKRKYEQIRSELYYAPTAYATSTYSEPRPYDTGSEISSATTGAAGNGNLGKNFSFAAATRGLLLGKDINSLHNTNDDHRNKMVLDPRVESHLIHSQKKAELNVYTDVVLSMNNERRGGQPPAIPTSYSSTGDHVYQVPRSSASSVGIMANLSELSEDKSISTHNLTSAALEEDSTSNIYEEIKPRK